MKSAIIVIVALCAIGTLAGLIVVKDDEHWRDGDPRHASRGAFRGAVIALVVCCIAIGALICGAVAAHARPSPYPVPDRFNGDRYEARAQMGADVARAVKAKTGAKARYRYPTRKRPPVSRKRSWDIPVPAPRPLAEPGAVDPLPLYGGVKREVIEAFLARNLAGVVPQLASKAREIVAACGSKVISGVRHTYIAGTGGRLSLHASGRAVDIKGNPSCIMAHLRGWPGGASVDYAAVNHTHISYAPGGAEWGRRFAHARSGHRHKRRARRG